MENMFQVQYSICYMCKFIFVICAPLDLFCGLFVMRNAAAGAAEQSAAFWRIFQANSWNIRLNAPGGPPGDKYWTL